MFSVVVGRMFWRVITAGVESNSKVLLCCKKKKVPTYSLGVLLVSISFSNA